MARKNVNITGQHRLSDIKRVVVIHSHTNPMHLRRLHGCILTLMLNGSVVWHAVIDTNADVQRLLTPHNCLMHSVSVCVCFHNRI